MLVLTDVDQFVGKYYSEAWIKRNILMQTDEEMEEIESQISDEGSDSSEEDDDF